MESLETYPGPIFASHVNPRAFCDTDRHLTDEAIKLLAKRDGVMGLVLLRLFWKIDWKCAPCLVYFRSFGRCFCFRSCHLRLFRGDE